MALFADMIDADPALSLVRPARRRIALLTGQSSPQNTALSPEQRTFLARVAPAGFATLAHGFPFHASYERRPYERPPIALASLHNARQFMAAMNDAAFRNVLAARLGELFERTEDRLILLTGSSGLQLLNAAWPHVCGAALNVQVLALGPACLARLNIPASCLTTIRGSCDAWSRLLYRHSIDHEVTCGHLSYWSSPEVIEVVRQLLAAGEQEQA